jgi:glycosyltransferase involved in cell wall biosynthesis
MNKIKVLVFHPRKQHADQLCIALQGGGYLLGFVTSFWHKFHLQSLSLLTRLYPPLKKELLKRYHKDLSSDLVSTFPYAELLRMGIDKLVGKSSDKRIYLVDRFHDKAGSTLFAHFIAQADMVISFENSSRHIFKKAHKLGKITILELSSLHYHFIGSLRQQYEAFRKSLPDDVFFDKVCANKERELKLANYIFTISELARQSLLDAGFAPGQVYKVNLGFDPVHFQPKKTYSQHTFKLIYAGTMTPRKGIHLIIKAFLELGLPDSSLTLVGPIDDAGELIKAHKGQVQYFPFMHHKDLKLKLQEADLFVFPSYFDGWAMIVLEAMACGTPVIVSENTGAKEAVSQGGGFIIPVDDLEALKEKIRYFYDNRTELETYGRKAHQIAQQYTWANYYKRVKEVIEEIALREGIAEKA